MSAFIPPALKYPFFGKEHAALASQVSNWASALSEEAVGDHGDLGRTCRALARGLGEAGILAAAAPQPDADGRVRHDVRSLCLTRQILGYRSGLLDFVFALQGLGSGAITLFGSQEQRQRYLVPAAAGEALPAFALSEARSGSDVANIETSARREGDSYVLNGQKTWISNAGIAGHYVVFARTGEGPGSRGLSAFIVEAANPGLRFVEKLEVVAAHPLGTIAFENCRVDASAMVGRAGEGFKVAMATLDVFRPSVAAAAAGFARRAIDEALGWTVQRTLAGVVLADQQATQMRFADMITETVASELLIYSAAWLRDSGADRITIEAAMAKLKATESAQITIDSAVQLLGGKGVLKGNVCEALYREIRALRIYEGTSEIQKLLIGRKAVADARSATAA